MAGAVGRIDGISQTYTSDSNGKYSIALQPGVYHSTVTAPGECDLSVYFVVYANQRGQMAYQPVIPFGPASACAPGANTLAVSGTAYLAPDGSTSSGTFTPDIGGTPAGASVLLYQGFNNFGYTPPIQNTIPSTTTGSYVFSSVAPGYYTLALKTNGYITGYNNVLAFLGAQLTINLVATPTLPTGKMQLLLTYLTSSPVVDSFGAVVPDGGTTTHIYSSFSMAFMPTLTHSQSTDGKATVIAQQPAPPGYFYTLITISSFNPGTYCFYATVVNPTTFGTITEASLMKSFPTLSVFQGSSAVEQFYMPASSGQTWKAIKIDGSSQAITTIGVVDDTQESSITSC